MPKQIIYDAVSRHLGAMLPGGVKLPGFSLEHPANETHGDYATNAAMMMNGNPRELAEKLVAELKKSDVLGEVVDLDRIEVAGPGFINFWLRRECLGAELARVFEEKEDYGRNEWLKGKKVMVEFTDPNPFKEFHIGHLMSNGIGESLARLFEFSGADLKRACYQGDVGMHVAKSIWGLDKKLFEAGLTVTDLGEKSLIERIKFMGQAYAFGATKYEDDEAVKNEINLLNKKIYEQNDGGTGALYEAGKKWSLEYFETIYRKLGTKFDHYFFESEVGEIGKRLVEEHKDIFEVSDGAIVFKGDKYDLHTRVFLNSLGLPTYEAKELGLAKAKYDKFTYDWSVVVTGNEINEYFKVLLKAMSLIFPELAAKTTHVGHGMLRLKSGKMSSRTGKVVTGEGLIADVAAEIRKKMELAARKVTEEEKDPLVEAIAVGAIKYSMLKQGPGKDIIFDFEGSLSFEGDSGPYLQYVFARTNSVLAKAGGIDRVVDEAEVNEEEMRLLRWIYRFGEVVELAAKQLAPNLLCSYLIELAQRFNTFYNKHQILGVETEKFRLGLTAVVGQVMKNGLSLLGIEAVYQM
ncbi:MAG: arginine--tRNA ligase [Microgenomates group bacterium]